MWRSRSLLIGIIAWTRPPTGRDVRRTTPFFLVAGALALVNVQSRLFKPEVEASSFLDRLLGAAAVV